MSGSKRNFIGGFTLVEIVMAVGIFAFAIMGVIFLLGTGLKSSAEVQRDSALSTALKTSASLLRTYDGTAPPAILYFDQMGSPVANEDKAYYKFSLTPTSSPTHLADADLFTVRVTAPHPATTSAGEFLISRLK